MPTQMRKEMPETNSNYESAFRRAGPALDLVLDPQFNQISMVFFVMGIRGPKDGMYSDHCVFKEQNHGIHCHDPL